jgi:hypothetical protein
MAGKKDRKWGRQKRRESFRRYWGRCFGTVQGVREEFPNRAALHAARRKARFQLMVMESRERRKPPSA